MSDERRARIDNISGQFFRKGKCAVCGGSVERMKTFTGSSMEDINRRADEWGKSPLRHKRCE